MTIDFHFKPKAFRKKKCNTIASKINYKKAKDFQTEPIHQILN